MPGLTYTEKKKKLIADFEMLNKSSVGAFALAKTTSNLFRQRTQMKAKRLDVKSFNTVLKVNTKDETVEVEGMTTFEDLVDATLAKGYLPLVVPELKTITIGGGVSGLAIESSSFKYGLVHESVQEMDILLADGRIVTARRDNEYSDLFYGLPNSYGTLGYVIKVTTKIRKAAPYVRLRHISFNDPKKYFKELELIVSTNKYEGESVDFVDGTAFSPTEMYITLGYDCDYAPYTSDYTDKEIYYKSIQKRTEDYLTTYDYIWRWDTDWFWCSKNVYADRPLMRRILGKKRLGSRTYGKMMRWEQRYLVLERLQRLLRIHRPSEPVIQDVEVPVTSAVDFLMRFDKEIGIRPVWVCPTKATTDTWPYPLYPMNPKKWYINFGFWDVVPTTKDPKKGHYNRLVEDIVEELGGMKSLYSASYYDQSRFEKLYNDKGYRALKKRYDAKGRFKTLYEKAVKAH